MRQPRIRPGARRTVALVVAGAVVLAIGSSTSSAMAGTPAAAAMPTLAATSGDTAVSTDSSYVKANARTPSDGDAIAFCGQNRRQQNEPAAAVDYRDSTIVTSGSNDYCTVQGDGSTWTGFYRSTDGGATWTDSLLPGYPSDTSPEGQASPLQQRGIANAGDPVQAWDTDGNLYFMGNAFNRSQPQYGSVWVATYDRDAAHYVRTVIVGKGTPAVNGKFNDKTSIEVDRTGGSHDGNVYVAWSVFQGRGNNEINFARSTNGGRTFSNPMKISDGSPGNQSADIAVTHNGDVYVAWNGVAGNGTNGRDAMLFAKSTDGGQKFTKPAVAADFADFSAADTAGEPTAPGADPRAAQEAEEAHEKAFENADGPESDAEPNSAGNSRDCGSGPFSCQSGFTFFRHASQPRITADPSDPKNRVWMVYDASNPSTVTPSTSTYNTAPVAADGTLQVAQGQIYLTSTSTGGRSWSAPRRLAGTTRGHQLFPDINADGGRLFAIWHDSRNDPAYSVQRPPGNRGATDAQGYHLAGNGLDTYGASSANGGQRWSQVRLSSGSQQPNYEMFGDRQVPFQGDYNYVSSVGEFAYGTWTDNRQVTAGDDPRYDYGTGFDVLQCRTPSTAPDSCPSAGGLDQDIFGASITP